MKDQYEMSRDITNENDFKENLGMIAAVVIIFALVIGSIGGLIYLVKLIF